MNSSSVQLEHSATSVQANGVHLSADADREWWFLDLLGMIVALHRAPSLAQALEAILQKLGTALAGAERVWSFTLTWTEKGPKRPFLELGEVTLDPRVEIPITAHEKRLGSLFFNAPKPIAHAASTLCYLARTADILGLAVAQLEAAEVAQLCDWYKKAIYEHVREEARNDPVLRDIDLEELQKLPFDEVQLID